MVDYEETWRRGGSWIDGGRLIDNDEEERSFGAKERMAEVVRIIEEEAERR